MKMISGGRYHLEITWLDKDLCLFVSLSRFDRRYSAMLSRCLVIRFFFFDLMSPRSPEGILKKELEEVVEPIRLCFVEELRLLPSDNLASSEAKSIVFK